jgi:hypothetical protein
MVERGLARLKDELRHDRSACAAPKKSWRIMFGVPAITVDQLLKLTG